MNIKPEQVPDEVVEAAFDAMRLAEASQFGDIKTPNNGARHECMRHALAAALPVLLGEPVGWMRRGVTYKAADGRADGERILGERQVYCDDVALYALPTQDTHNAE